MMSALCFIMAAGGTGGHVLPALAVAHELRGRGHSVHFAGTRTGAEARLVPPAGFPLEWISIGGFQRVGLVRMVRTAAELPIATARMWNWMRRLRPAAVLSLGGYVAAPVVAAALLRGVPVVAMEPNAHAGLVNRLTGRRVKRALLGLPGAERFFPPGSSEIIGVPVRKAFFHIAARPVGNPATVLITGGSQGSRRLNQAFEECWPLLRDKPLPVRFLHQAGRNDAADLAGKFAATGLAGEVTAFIDDMPAAYQAADLIVSRSGAGAVAELAAAGKAAILVPFPFAADDHQTRNAEAARNAGAAVLVPDSEMTGRRLYDEIAALLADPARLARMGSSARQSAHPAAAARAATVLEQIARKAVDTGIGQPKQ